jgi:hypothetical protein
MLHTGTAMWIAHNYAPLHCHLQLAPWIECWRDFLSFARRHSSAAPPLFAQHHCFFSMQVRPGYAEQPHHAYFAIAADEITAVTCAAAKLL